VATTCDDWLPILAKRLDDRYVGSTTEGEYPGVEKLRRYAHGHADLPEMGPNLRASWAAFQRKARRDLGGLAVGSLADRCAPNGIRIGTADTSPALIAARRIWRDNRMDVQVAEAIHDYLETRYAYLVVGTDGGQAVITREKPEEFIAATDPLRPWKAIAAEKVWRDRDAGLDFARVWVTGAAQMYVRPMCNEFGTERSGASGGDWLRMTPEPELYDGDPPIIVWERGEALLEPHLDVIDGINLGKLHRLVITAMQAFRQRALKKDKDAPEIDKDADGNDIDLSKVFEPSPGALWELPEGWSVWESQTAELIPLLEGEKADVRDFAAVLRTPISAFIPDGQNQTAEGAAQAKEGQISRAHAVIRDASPSLAVMIVYALRAEGMDLGGDTVEILWTPPEHVSMTEKYTAAVQAKAAGRSRKGILRDILGMSPDQIAQEETDAAGDALMAALALPMTAPAPAPTPTAPVMADAKQPAA
jgi:hypothetical protein